MAARTTTWASRSPWASHLMTSAMKPGDFVSIGPVVDDAAIDARNADGAGAPEPGALVLLEEARVEMKVEDHTVQPDERGVDRHDADVIHRLCVTGDSHAVLVFRIRNFLSADDRDCLILSQAEAFDRRRTLHRSGLDESAQRPKPRGWRAHPATQCTARLVQSIELARQLPRERGGRVEHTPIVVDFSTNRKCGYQIHESRQKPRARGAHGHLSTIPLRNRREPRGDERGSFPQRSRRLTQIRHLRRYRS